jgi:hypothetical protein
LNPQIANSEILKTHKPRFANKSLTIRSPNIIYTEASPSKANLLPNIEIDAKHKIRDGKMMVKETIMSVRGRGGSKLMN